MSTTDPVVQIEYADSELPFQMHTMQWIEEHRWQQNGVPHKHNYYVIVWVKNGSGTHLIDLDKYQITPGTIYCLTPGQVHLLKGEKGIEGCVISFTTDFLCLAEQNYDLLF